MSTSDPRVTFELQTGRVHLEGDNARMLVVPAAALASLLGASTSERDALHAGRAIGEAVGARASKADDDGSIDAVLTRLAEALALVGLGAISLEKWGRALIVAIDDAVELRDDFIAAVVEGALSKATSREVKARAIGRHAARLRVFVGRAQTVERLGKLLDEGVGWGDALVRLHDAEAAA